MKKRLIKVIKADAESAAPKTPTTKERRVLEHKVKVEGDREMTSTVKNWISERRENRKDEELDAKDSRFAWSEDDAPEPAG